jgi:cell division GTPase FtsZ
VHERSGEEPLPSSRRDEEGDDHEASMSITPQLPTLSDLRPIIKVVGVGGAGGNAINNMIASGLKDVDYIVANTDAQALASSGALRQRKKRRTRSRRR